MVLLVYYYVLSKKSLSLSLLSPCHEILHKKEKDLRQNQIRRAQNVSNHQIKG